eukprot:8743429-Pyramimonas_sp.AAC.1
MAPPANPRSLGGGEGPYPTRPKTRRRPTTSEHYWHWRGNLTPACNRQNASPPKVCHGYITRYCDIPPLALSQHRRPPM